MVVICLADVAERFHGFLRSAMLNPHPGVYLAMDLPARVGASGQSSSAGGRPSRVVWG